MEIKIEKKGTLTGSLGWLAKKMEGVQVFAEGKKLYASIKGEDKPRTIAVIMSQYEEEAIFYVKFNSNIVMVHPESTRERYGFFNTCLSNAAYKKVAEFINEATKEFNEMLEE